MQGRFFIFLPLWLEFYLLECIVYFVQKGLFDVLNTCFADVRNVRYSVSWHFTILSVQYLRFRLLLVYAGVFRVF